MNQTHREYIKKLLLEHKDKSNVFKRNVVKEYMQVLALSFIYSSPKYKNLVFYGGSSLRHCFGLERMSEDIDFVDVSKNVNTEDLAGDLVGFFSHELEISAGRKNQKFRAYLKIPILKELGLAGPGESDLLFIKVEVYKDFDSCSGYKIEAAPVFKYGRSTLVMVFDLSTLMSTKINAVLHRKWRKSEKSGETICAVKGRDYYDLMWYLQKGVAPNYNCLGELKDKDMLKAELLKTVERLDSKSILLDLE